MTIPLASIIKPDPKALAFLFCGVPNSLNMSSKGEPGGNSNGNGFPLVTTVWVDEIFTTDGINFSAKSAKELGEFAAFKEKFKFIIKNERTNVFKNLYFILAFKIPYN